jgi:predicted outer membrane protein
MIRTFFAAAAVLAFASTAAYSAEEKMACDDATVMKMEEAAMAMKDPAMKESMEMAMKEVETAKMAMKEGKTDDCSMHLGEAMKATMKK